MTFMSDALRTELETLTAAIRAFDARSDWKARMNEPAEMTAKRNRATEITHKTKQ